MLTFIYLHCQAPPSVFCRGRYKNSGDWFIDWLVSQCSGCTRHKNKILDPHGFLGHLSTTFRDLSVFKDFFQALKEIGKFNYFHGHTWIT